MTLLRRVTFLNGLLYTDGELVRYVKGWPQFPFKVKAQATIVVQTFFLGLLVRQKVSSSDGAEPVS